MAAIYTKYKYIGKNYTLNDGTIITISDYNNYRDVSVKFENGEIIGGYFMSQIKKGTIRNPFKKTSFGIGFIGNGKYKTTHKFYNIWQHMLYRCYSPKTTNTYIDCSVDTRWHNFQIFAEWCELNYVEGFHLDKDILSNETKIYSPETCCFIPQEINNLFYSSNFKNNSFGVRTVNDKTHRPRIKINSKEVYIGTFENLTEAQKAYKIIKSANVKDIANKWKDKIPETVYNVLMNYFQNG